MAFLDNSGDIILDAVLTDTGRLRLAKGDGSFNITKFALGDDEINYELYDKNHPSGSAYFDVEILQSPVLEAFTNNTSVLKSKLLSVSRTNLLYLPVLQLNEKDNCVVFENVNNKNHPAQLAYFGLPIAHKYYMESTYGSLQFKEGDIVLFNPDQPHYVPAAKEEHDDYRIALVFNVSAPFRLLSIEE